MADAHWNQANSSRTPLSEEADVWRQFAAAVRQEIESLRGELEQWQREHVEPIRQSLLTQPTLPSRGEIERPASLSRREPALATAYSSSIPSANPATSRSPQRVEEEATDDDRLRFLKERLARQLGTEGGGA